MLCIKSTELFNLQGKIKELGGRQYLKKLPCGYKSKPHIHQINGEAVLLKTVKRLDSTVYLESLDSTRYFVGVFKLKTI